MVWVPFVGYEPSNLLTYHRERCADAPFRGAGVIS